MKILLSFITFFIFSSSFLSAFQVHDQNLVYTHPAIVVFDGVAYISTKSVPAGIPTTSTEYWTPLLSTAPSSDAGDPPTTEPDTSDSDLSNLTPPEDNPNSKVIYVDDNASESGDGTSWLTAFKYLQDALAVAESGDEIWVAEGTYKPDQGAGKNAGDRASPFVLVNGVGMYGGFLGTETTRDPQGDFNQTILSGEISDDSELWSLHVVSGYNLDTNTTLDGFRITKGNANGVDGTVNDNGGGLWVGESKFKVSNCEFSLNSAFGRGGGIYTYESSLEISNCLFSTNSANFGGGICSGYGSTDALNNCLFSTNSANFGGGLYVNDQSANITNCKFIYNSATSLGGGIKISNKSSFTNCVFTNNSASQGGGLYSYNSQNFTNCIFNSNSANNKGGGVFSPGTFTNCLFINNSASKGGASYIRYETYFNNCVLTNNSANNGSAIFNIVEGGMGHGMHISLILTNCILWKNQTSDIDGYGLTSGDWKSVILQEAVEAAYPGDPNARDLVYKPNLNILQSWDGDSRAFDADPLFVNIDDPVGPDGKWFTEDDGLRLQAGSPAIDAGYDLNDSEKYDIAGFLRRQGESIDIGAYEYGDQVSEVRTHDVILSITPNGAGTVQGGGNDIIEGESINIYAMPNLGYVFSYWSGDINSSSPQVSTTVDSDLAIVANFREDHEDLDGDGLTNFAEIVLYGTDVDNNDTDGDGLLDETEVAIGSDPKKSDSAVINHLKDQDPLKGLSLEFLLAISELAAIEEVQENPNLYGLYSKEDLNASNALAWTQGFEKGFIASQNSPGSDVRLTQSEFAEVKETSFSQGYSSGFNDGKKSGIETGVGNVLSNPFNFDLKTKSEFDDMIDVMKNLVTDPIVIDMMNSPEGLERLLARKVSPVIGVIDIQRIFDNYYKVHQAREVLDIEKNMAMSILEEKRDEMELLVDELKAIEASLQINETTELISTYKERVEDAKILQDEMIAIDEYFKEYISNKQRELLVDHLSDITLAAQVIAKQNQVDILINSAEQSLGIFYANAQNDYSQQVLNQLNYSTDVRDLIPLGNDLGSTPVVNGWFYIPNNGWFYTNAATYPFIFSGSSKEWIYFQGGYEKPKFYNYRSKRYFEME